MSNKEVVKDVRTAVQLEQELQISYAQRGVAVLDIYSAEWGPCKAITESFRRLATDQGDGVHLRFLSVECHAILASLKHPEEQRNPQRPKNIDAIRDTLPEGWQSILEERAGQSKPYFLFYKEGKKAGFVEGVQTPQIREVVKDLCTVKTPASDFITNPRLQEFWEEVFNPEESDVPLDKFFKGVLVACKYTVSFSDTEKAILVDVLGIKDNKDKNIVTAEGLQKWIGDDEVKTVAVLIAEALPEYEARAASVLQKEAEERKAQEEQRAREAEEEAARTKAEQAAKEEAAKAAAKAAASQDSLGDLVAQVPEVKDAGDVAEGEHELSIRASIGGADLNGSSLSSSKVELMSSDNAAQQAANLLEILGSAASLSQWLASLGRSLTTINAARSAANQKVASSQSSLGKLAALLTAVSSDVLAAAFGIEDVDLSKSLVEGTLFTTAPSVAAALISTAAVDAPPSLSVIVSREAVTGADGLAEGASFVLPPLTILRSGVDGAAADGEVKLTIHGVPHAVALAGAADTFATHWFVQCTVASISESEIIANFAEYVQQGDFDAAATNVSTQSHTDEKKCQTLEKIQSRMANGEPFPATAAAAPPAAEEAPEEAEAAAAPEPAPAPEAPEAAEEEAPAAGSSDQVARESSQGSHHSASAAAAADAASNDDAVAGAAPAEAVAADEDAAAPAAEEAAAPQQEEEAPAAAEPAAEEEAPAAAAAEEEAPVAAE